MTKNVLTAVLLVCVSVSPAAAQQDQHWNLYFQATSIGQYHGLFHAPYEGVNSLHDSPERDVSLTTTLFFSLRLTDNTVLIFDPEIAGGRGFSGVTGIADAPNGELPRVASATPKPYLARLYVSHDFALGDEKESFDADQNQLAGSRPVKRYTVTAGRFTISDFMDNNRYTHDPRTQFMGWGVMINGAWDYPADTRGYTWGWVHELHTSQLVSALRERGRTQGRQRRPLRPPAVPGPRRRSSKPSFATSLHEHPGTLRLLNYENRTRSGSYGDAVKIAAATGTTPDVTAIRRPGTLKYGFGINSEQEIAKTLGVFMRLGWNDGKTEDFAFTAIDRLASGGVSWTGARWHRPKDTLATAFTAAGISGVHALYLSRGGLDFLIGDGQTELCA